MYSCLPFVFQLDTYLACEPRALASSYPRSPHLYLSIYLSIISMATTLDTLKDDDNNNDLLENGLENGVDDEEDWSDSGGGDDHKEHTHSEESESDTSTGAAERRNLKEVRDYTRKENQAVDMWRDLVTGVLVIVACCVSLASYIYLSHNETLSYQQAVREVLKWLCLCACLYVLWLFRSE